MKSPFGIKAATLVCAVALPIAAWSLPDPKDAAIDGRLDYPQFLLFIGTLAMSVSGVAAALARESLRRIVLTRIAVIWLSASLTLGSLEIAAWALPRRHLLDNPWYQASGRGMTSAADLPYLRPAHMKWTGLSRGDLSWDDNTPDKDARTVTFATDAEGFRNDDEAEFTDIVFIGDSFTEAGNTPIDEIFSSLVGMLTRSRVRNLGVAGFAPPTELIVLRHFGLKRAPTTVVWQIAESNDLQDAVDYTDWIAAGRPGFQEQISLLPDRSEAWARRSPTRRVFDLLRTPKPWPVHGAFTDADGIEHDVRFEESLPGRDQKPEGHPGWPVMCAALREGGRVLSERGINLVVVLVPMKFRAMAASIRFDALRLTRPDAGAVVLDSWPAAFDLRHEETMASRLEEICRETGATFVDATPELKRLAADGRMGFLPMDTHLSPEGHRLVAELILKALASRKSRG